MSRPTTTTLEHTLFLQYEILVKDVVKEFRPEDHQTADLFSVGRLGLLNAVKKALGDINRTTALQSIRAAIRAYIAQNINPEVVGLEDLEEDGVNTVGSGIHDNHLSPEDMAMLNQALDQAHKLTNRFPEPTKTILRMKQFWPYYFPTGPATFTEIASELHMTALEVETIYTNASKWISSAHKKALAGERLKKTLFQGTDELSNHGN